MKYHQWKLVERSQHITKHVCRRCLLVKVTASVMDGFPTRKYTTKEGCKQVGGTVPECLQ